MSKLSTLIKTIILENKELLPERDLFEGFDESVLNEDYPETFNFDEFKQIRSYAGKMKYAAQHLGKPIGQGSSRIVYRIDNNKVLKLAKNRKGIGQNSVEIDWGRESYYEDIIAKIFDADFDNYYWVEMELATRAKKDDFKRLWDADFEDVGKYLFNREAENRNGWQMYTLDPDVKDELDNNEYVGELVSFMFDSNNKAGDLTKLNSYGIVRRPMGEYLVVIDYGLNKDVWTSYYS